MNQTKKNLLDYSDSAIHFLGFVKKAHLTKSQKLEFLYMLSPIVEDYLRKHTVHISVPKGFDPIKALNYYTETPEFFNNYIVCLGHYITNARHNHINLSAKTKFVVIAEDKIEEFDKEQQLDPELQKITHMSTKELEKHVRELGAY